ncbi:Phosphotransferase enzyme family [Goodfellowiella coeruleoviolacea]|uniref:Phosphotransferase enzyme family n=2 Tax=Goodfellowiella coeruleoviolacea TaxID=334858 RepID=A0AAE3GK18_9PSEU|nr:Phosphotransferase enzyme family [Goodfellowiella coeruleoviolacea]
MVTHVIPNRRGRSCDLAATLVLADQQRVFVKGVSGVSRRMWFLRNESTAPRLAGDLAPRVLFHADFDQDDWLVVVFEHVEGRAADFTPGSGDLPRIAGTLDQLSGTTAPGVRSLRERWSGGQKWRALVEDNQVGGWAEKCLSELTKWEAVAPELLVGDALLHTDLHQDQFIIGADGSVRVIDWGWPASGAPWVDVAFLVIRLIAAGHTPAEAERWAAGVPAWSTADGDAVTAFACYVSGLWSTWALTKEGLGWRASCARRYAAWRLGQDV